jgi:hypothetical protein
LSSFSLTGSSRLTVFLWRWPVTLVGCRGSKKKKEGKILYRYRQNHQPIIFVDAFKRTINNRREGNHQKSFYSSISWLLVWGKALATTT